MDHVRLRKKVFPRDGQRAKHLHERVQCFRELSQLLIDKPGQQNRPGLKVILDQEPGREEVFVVSAPIRDLTAQAGPRRVNAKVNVPLT